MRADAWLSENMRDPHFLEGARNTLKTANRIHIQNVLADVPAKQLYDALVAASWNAAFNTPGAVQLLSEQRVAAIDPGQRESGLKDIHARAQGGFQFLYDCHPIPQHLMSGSAAPNPLSDFVRTLNSPETLELLKTLTGDRRIVSVSAQATRYRPGHFLTEHDDNVAGETRLFAYVFNFTPTWHADWGGLLTFFRRDGHVQEAYTPAWNALNVFPVGQPHAVSFVAPFAGAFRYSITGWFLGPK